MSMSAERAALAVALQNTEAASRVVEQLTAEDWPKAYRQVFAAISELVREGVTPDVVTLAEAKPAAVESIGGVVALNAMLDEPAYPSLTANYINLVKEGGVRRSLLETAEAANRAALDGEPIEAILSLYEAASTKVRERLGGSKIGTSSTLDALYKDLWEWWASEDDTLTRFKHPWRKMNDTYGGFGAGELLVVTGYSGDGKSIAGLQYFDSLTAAGENVAYFSLEMPALQVGRRLIAMGGVPIWKMKRSEQRNDNYLSEQALQSVSRLQGRPGRVYGGSATLGRIRAEQAKHRYNVIIVDHLHRMPYRERADLESTVRAFKNLALDTNCAVILLCQLARRDGFPSPTLAQLRDTAVIEHEADGVLAVYRTRDSDGLRTEEAQLRVLKMRDGESDTFIDMLFRPERMSFVEASAHPKLNGEIRKDKKAERHPVNRTEPYRDTREQN